jgi:hypothetical protein
MKRFEGTKGLWEIEESGLKTAINSGLKHVAMVNYYQGLKEVSVFGKEHEANTRAIAAVPELIEALQDLLGELDDIQEYEYSKKKEYVCRHCGRTYYSKQTYCTCDDCPGYRAREMLNKALGD